MIQVIQHGNKKRIECQNCGALLSYERERREMSKSLCHDCRHNCTDHKTKSCINYKGIWCNVEYGRVIKKKIKGCKDYERREK